MSTLTANITSFTFFNHVVKDAFASFLDNVAKTRMLRKTVRELDALSDRDLHDLGISRSAIKSVARQAVYGL